MNLIQQAESDLEFVLEDSENGFGVTLSLTDPDSNEYEVVGNTSDIGFFMDVETGIATIGRTCEVAIRISSLTDLGGGYPNKNWKVSYTDINNNTYNCFIAQSPKTDRTLGIYLLLLEAGK